MTQRSMALPAPPQVRRCFPISHFTFRCLGHKLIGAVGLAVTVGLVGLVAFYVERQEQNILIHNERTMRNLTGSVIRSLQTVMLAGYADVAQVFADRLRDVPEVMDFRILRTDGNEAFRDNRTIADVNRRRGDEVFLPRDGEAVVPVVPPLDERLQDTLASKEVVAYYESIRGEDVLTFLAPILNEEKCFKCHGRAKAVRGVLKLTTSLKPVKADVRATWIQAGLILVCSVVLILVATNHMIRRSVVRPIADLARAMSLVSSGQLNHSLPVSGRDELGIMANSFNHMTEELLATLESFRSEQDKLTTIILTANEGMVVTDGSGHVVLVNPAAERLLGRSAAEITAAGFMALFGDESVMAARLADPTGAVVMRFNDRVLSVTASAIRGESGRIIGSTALLRDITEAKRLEEQLRAQSVTDGLTGLANRRFLEQCLQTEWDRARLQASELSVLMVDIDHFKKFNDTHGHDQGDRVLKAVAQAMRDSMRTVDVPCRYGGEEFVVILRQTGLAGALITGERLRRNVEDMEVDGLKVTVTIGVASLREVEVTSPSSLLEVADAALYEGKKSGRNRLVVARRSEAAGSLGPAPAANEGTG